MLRPALFSLLLVAASECIPGALILLFAVVLMWWWP